MNKIINLDLHPINTSTEYLNICKEKKLTNVRSSTGDIFERLEPPVKFSLEEALDFISGDELAEITPTNVRMRKRVLNKDARYRIARSKGKT